MNRVWVLLRVLLGNAVRGIRRAPMPSALAIATIAVVLMLVGCASLVLRNMDKILDEVGEQLLVTAYLEPDVEAEAQRELAMRVASAPGVERVEVVTREEALERFERIAGGADLLAGLDENPLPASLEIHLHREARTTDTLAALEEALDGLPGIDEFRPGQEWIEGYARAVGFLRTVATGLSIVLGAAALLIVANTIRLAVYARRDELDILALVGASRTFVRVPFVLEGTIQGLLGGLLALLLVFGAFELLLPQLREALAFVVGRAELRFFDLGESLRLVLSGAWLGLLGSITALVGWKS